MYVCKMYVCIWTLTGQTSGQKAIWLPYQRTVILAKLATTGERVYPKNGRSRQQNDNRDLKHWRMMGRRRPTGSGRSNLNTTTHAGLVVHMLDVQQWTCVNLLVFLPPRATFLKQISSQLRIRLSTYFFFALFLLKTPENRSINLRKQAPASRIETFLFAFSSFSRSKKVYRSKRF